MTGTMKPRLHRFRLHAQQLGSLLYRAFLDVAQDEHEPEAVRQIIDSSFYQRLYLRQGGVTCRIAQ